MINNWKEFNYQKLHHLQEEQQKQLFFFEISSGYGGKKKHYRHSSSAASYQLHLAKTKGLIHFTTSAHSVRSEMDDILYSDYNKNTDQ